MKRPTPFQLSLILCITLRVCAEPETIRTGALTLELDASGRAVDLRHGSSGERWLAAPCALFRLRVGKGKAPDSPDASQVAGKLTAAPQPGGEIHLTLTVENTGGQPCQVAVTFPELRGLRLQDRKRSLAYCFPVNGLVVGEVPAEFRQRHGAGSDRMFPWKFIDIYHPQAGGIYVIPRDGENHERSYYLRKAPGGTVDIGVDFAPRTLRAKEKWTLPVTAIGAHEGDWRVALRAYRDGARGWSRRRARASHLWEPLGDDLARVRRLFFGGGGIWLAGTSWSAAGLSRAALRLIAKTHKLLQLHGNAFAGSGSQPLVPTLDSVVFANRFQRGPKTVWTLYNSGKSRTTGEVLRVRHLPGATYWNVWDDRVLKPRIDGETAVLAVAMEPGAVSCVLQMDERDAEAVKRAGATVFRRSGCTVEVLWNRSAATDAHLEAIGRLPDLTDLSLEQTAVGDAGVAHLSALDKLEWLNLYRTRVGDAGLRHLSRLPNLQHLPVGETRVTDAGLEYLSGLTTLRYLGLRGNAVTDAGIAHLRGLRGLTGLHLGETKITDKGVARLAPFSELRKLWLHDTQVSDASVPVLIRLGKLRELFVYRTRISAAGVKQLKAALPACEVVEREP